MIATATLPIIKNQKRSYVIICDKTRKLFPWLLYGYIGINNIEIKSLQYNIMIKLHLSEHSVARC